MRIAVIGRTEILYDTAVKLREAGHHIVCILTSKEAPEYTRKAEDFRVLAQTWSIPFAQGAQINEYFSFLEDVCADIAVSINYTGVIPQKIIDIFPLGILNAHGGDLPKYRGNACQAWAILNGEERIGLCIHRMIGGELDSGDIIARDYFTIDINTKVTQVWNWITNRTPELILDAVEVLKINPDFILEQQSKDPNDALRCYPRKPEDGRINWKNSSLNVLRLINACNKPYSGAFCDLNGEKLIIWDASLVNDGEIFCAIPGQITKIGESFIDVACGSGKLRISLVEYRGEIASPNTFIRSSRSRLL